MKVTCIIPIGPDNHRYLEEALNSAAGARALGIYDEVIMCVSATTEFHPSIQSYANLGFKLIVTYDASIGRQKNLAIAQASGDWVCTLDCDDLLDLDGQKLVREQVERQPMWRVVHFGTVHEFGLGQDYNWPRSEDVNYDKLEQVNFVPVCAWHSKMLWWKTYGYEHVRYEDWHFWKKAKQYVAAQFIHLNQVFYHHRRHWESIGGRTNWDSSLGHDFEPVTACKNCGTILNQGQPCPICTPA